jgi:carbon monoxide dehydrogenase subunit G
MATIVMDQKSKIGNVTASIKMQLNTIDNSTEIDYKGEAKLSGKLAMMGQRIIGGVVKSLSKQFFMALDNEIKNVNSKPNSYAN